MPCFSFAIVQDIDFVIASSVDRKHFKINEHNL